MCQQFLRGGTSCAHDGRHALFKFVYAGCTLHVVVVVVIVFVAVVVVVIVVAVAAVVVAVAVAVAVAVTVVVVAVFVANCVNMCLWELVGCEWMCGCVGHVRACGGDVHRLLLWCCNCAFAGDARGVWEVFWYLCFACWICHNDILMDNVAASVEGCCCNLCRDCLFVANIVQLFEAPQLFEALLFSIRTARLITMTV